MSFTLSTIRQVLIHLLSALVMLAAFAVGNTRLYELLETGSLKPT